MRRIEALTGRGAEEYVRERRTPRSTRSRASLGAAREAVLSKLESLLAEQERAPQEGREAGALAGLRLRQSGKLAETSHDVDGVRRRWPRDVEAPSVDALRFMGDALAQVAASGVAVLGAHRRRARRMFVALVSQDLVERGLHAGNLLKGSRGWPAAAAAAGRTWRRAAARTPRSWTRR